MLRIWLTLALASALSTVACAQQHSEIPPTPQRTSLPPSESQHMETATLAGGCFWCIEAVFQRLEGVTSVASGYSGGSEETADYKLVSSGSTQHAEACQITFDPSVISFDEILQVFFMAHDPTTLNKQGNDVGPQYRSAVFYHSEEQKLVVDAYIQQLTSAGTWANAIVTEVAPYQAFYKAEEYHQNYYNQNGSQPYCAFVVRPKVEKFLKNFDERVKEEYR